MDLPGGIPPPHRLEGSLYEKKQWTPFECAGKNLTNVIGNRKEEPDGTTALPVHLLYLDAKPPQRGRTKATAIG